MPLIERFIKSSADITDTPCGGFQVDERNEYMGWVLYGQDKVRRSFEGGDIVGLVINVRSNLKEGGPSINPSTDYVAAAYEISRDQADGYQKGDMIRQYMSRGTDGQVGEEKGFSQLWLSTRVNTHYPWKGVLFMIQKGHGVDSRLFAYGANDWPRAWARANKPPPPAASFMAPPRGLAPQPPPRRRAEGAPPQPDPGTLAAFKGLTRSKRHGGGGNG